MGQGLQFFVYFSQYSQFFIVSIILSENNVSIRRSVQEKYLKNFVNIEIAGSGTCSLHFDSY